MIQTTRMMMNSGFRPLRVIPVEQLGKQVTLSRLHRLYPTYVTACKAVDAKVQAMKARRRELRRQLRKGEIVKDEYDKQLKSVNRFLRNADYERHECFKAYIEIHFFIDVRPIMEEQGMEIF